MKKIFAAFALAIALAGCSSLGLAPAQSTDQKLAYSYGTIAAIRTSTAQALKAGTITLADAQKVLVDSDAARAALDAGKVALASGGVNAQSVVATDLAIAAAAIAQLQSFLISKGVK